MNCDGDVDGILPTTTVALLLHDTRLGGTDPAVVLVGYLALAPIPPAWTDRSNGDIDDSLHIWMIWLGMYRPHNQICSWLSSQNS